MTATTSADGTTIGYDSRGSADLRGGPALILVDGAMCWRDMGTSGKIADVLAADFTVYRYDRRGRGESGNTFPFSPEREVEDLAAVVAVAIAETGSAPYVCGFSSGAMLALEACNAGVPMAGLALYEAPLIVDNSREFIPADEFNAHVASLLEAGRPGDVVKYFLRDAVQLPGFLVAIMPLFPAWKKMKGIAHTMPYDFAVTTPHWTGRPLPTDRWTTLSTRNVLVADGGKSPEWMQNANAALASTIGAVHRRLPGQTHMVKPAAISAALKEFFVQQAEV